MLKEVCIQLTVWLFKFYCVDDLFQLQKGNYLRMVMMNENKKDNNDCSKEI